MSDHLKSVRSLLNQARTHQILHRTEQTLVGAIEGLLEWADIQAAGKPLPQDNPLPSLESAQQGLTSIEEVYRAYPNYKPGDRTDGRSFNEDTDCPGCLEKLDEKADAGEAFCGPCRKSGRAAAYMRGCQAAEAEHASEIAAYEHDIKGFVESTSELHDRLVTIVDEAFGLQPVQETEELLTLLEHKLSEDRIAQRKRISELEAQLAERTKLAADWEHENARIGKHFELLSAKLGIGGNTWERMYEQTDAVAAAVKERNSLKEQLAERDRDIAERAALRKSESREASALREQLRLWEATRTDGIWLAKAWALHINGDHAPAGAETISKRYLASLPPSVAPEPADPPARSKPQRYYWDIAKGEAFPGHPVGQASGAQAQAEPEQPWNPQVNDYVRFKPGADTQRKADAGDTWRIRETITDGESVVAIKLKMRDGEYDLSLFEPAEPPEQHDPGRPHLIKGEFQSDKYPTTPRGKVPLSCKDPTAQDLLWEYAQRRRAVDAEFADDLEEALRIAGYVHKVTHDGRCHQLGPQLAEPPGSWHCRDCGATSDDRGCIQHNVTCGHTKAWVPAEGEAVRVFTPSGDAHRLAQMLRITHDGQRAECRLVGSEPAPGSVYPSFALGDLRPVELADYPKPEAPAPDVERLRRLEEWLEREAQSPDSDHPDRAPAYALVLAMLKEALGGKPAAPPQKYGS